jgi:hypothetical protein
LSPVKSTRNRRQVAGDGSALILGVDKSLTLHENGGNTLQVTLEQLEELNVLLLKLVLDNGSVEELGEGIKQLELANDGVAVIETLSENRCESSLKLLDTKAELVEVVIESSLFNVHDLILDLHEKVNGGLELSVDGVDCVGQGLTLGVTDLDVSKSSELLDGLSEVHDILASLLE